jgi:hypothetical protein
MGGFAGASGPAADDDEALAPKAKSRDDDDIAAIKKQLADLQAKLSKL